MQTSLPGMLAAIVVAVGAAGCQQGTMGTETERQPAAEPGAVGTSGYADPAGSVTVADIVGNPDRYMGQTVTVVAEVNEVFGPRAFALDEDAPLAAGIDRDLVVLSRTGINLAPLDDRWLNDKVRVTGKVGRASVVEVEREVGWDLDPEIEVELEDVRAVLVADAITRAQ